MQPMLVDSHCHLHMLESGKSHPDIYLNAARERGIGHFLTVSVDLDSVDGLLDMAARYPQVSTSVGVHPCGRQLRMESPETLAAMAAPDHVVAIGETGLDYLCTEDSDREWHHQRFRDQIRAAKLAGKPLIIHTRGAAEDTIRILREEGADAVGGVIHCFTENWTSAKAFMDLGFYISLSGIITFPKSHGLRKVSRKLPMDRIMVETDAPYLAPVPHRGGQNQPAFVREVAECLAEVRDVPLPELAERTSENFRQLFGVGL
ncbi:TatD family hydrolase [Methylonatrum kenyense]|uniref:TatD family hydrolase n=1 Tax=Methylonatrum kenyense TaxID=455253 RepID=UPI0031F4C719